MYFTKIGYKTGPEILKFFFCPFQQMDSEMTGLTVALYCTVRALTVYLPKKVWLE